MDPLVMGVVNVTPDSFSDGGLYFSADAAVAHGEQLLNEGAGVLDVGGESTRPGAEPVSLDEELRRVVPVIERLSPATISIDTRKVAVAEAALQAGATIVNDVSAFRHDPAIAGVVASSGAGCCLMHMLGGDPRTMQDDPVYDDVVSDVKAFLEERLEFAVAEGVPAGAPRGRRRPGAARGEGLARPRDRVREDGRPQPPAPAPARRACGDR